MKKLLIVLFATIVISGCSKSGDDNDDYPNISNYELAFIQVKFNIKLIETPYNNKLSPCNIFLFYLDNKHLKEGTPNPYSFEYNGKYVCTISDVNNEEIFSDYSGEFTQDTDTNGKYVLGGTHSIYNFNLLSSSNLKKGKYLIVIQTEGTYFCRYETINTNEKYCYLSYNLIQTKENESASKYVWF